jgi:acetolactate synthase-1/2/3 large subunit
MIRWKQTHMGFNDYGLTYGNPDFVKYAESYGGIGHRLTQAADLTPTLEHCINTPGVHLIDAPVDYSENDHILNQEIKTLSAKI